MRTTGIGLAAAALGMAAVLAFGAAAAGARQQAPAGQGYKVVGTWGKDGVGNGQFHGASGLAVDRSGTVHVTDYNNNRVQVFSSTGTFLAKWGTLGDGNGQFTGAEDVAVAPDGTVWVADYVGSRAEQFKADGTYLTTIDISGFKEGASGIAVDADGNVFIAIIGETYGGIRRFDKTPTGYENKGIIGRGDWRSEDVEISPDGTVYEFTTVPGAGDLHIRRYEPDGKALGSFAPSGAAGFGFGVDLDCNIWINDAPNRQDAKYSPSGKRLATAVSPDLVAIDTAMGPKGDLYVINNNGPDGNQIVHFLADKRKPATANVPKAISVKGGKATIPYAATGFACPAQVTATATIKGRGVSGKATTKVAAGKKTPIAMSVHGPAGKTVKATFTIVLKTNGRSTTETKSVTVRFAK